MILEENSKRLSVEVRGGQGQRHKGTPLLGRWGEEEKPAKETRKKCPGMSWKRKAESMTRRKDGRRALIGQVRQG